MSTYVLLDSLNTFHRAKHHAGRQSDDWMKIGFALHLCIASINKAVRDFGADHVVICTEGRSWRKDFYPPYKRNRQEARQARTEKEVESDEEFNAAFNDMLEFFKNETACSVLHHKEAEADDLIARWIALHPEDDHIIVSSDSDFQQLLATNVRVYNGIAGELWTINGILDDKGRPVIDKKTKEPKAIPDPNWLLFEKCIRGDKSDNIFSAYPGARTKGTKNKIGITEAFSDRDSKGYNWNNFMLQRWEDHEGKEHKVLTDYGRNQILIDLTMQPDDIKQKVDEGIINTIKMDKPSQIGVRFLKFCGKYDLKKLSDQCNTIAAWLQKEYTGNLAHE